MSRKSGVTMVMVSQHEFSKGVSGQSHLAVYLILGAVLAGQGLNSVVGLTRGPICVVLSKSELFWVLDVVNFHIWLYGRSCLV